MSAAALPLLPPSAELLPALLDLSISGVVYYLPVQDEAGQVIDFTFGYLNPAAQRQLHLPAQPAATYRQQYPGSVETGVWDFHREAYLAGGPHQFTKGYQIEGDEHYFLIAAQRVGEGLLVSFTDTSEHAHTPVGQALRDSRAREQQAQAEAERQRGELQRVFEQAPVAIAVYRGPNYIIELANPTVARLWGRTQEQLIGRGLFEALPEVAGMGYEELLNGVMATGVPYVAHAMEAVHEREGRRDTVYWDFVYQPMRDASGHIYGAMVVATEVTAQVQARQQAERLNQELEDRVQQRTQALAEQQRLLSQILGQVPAGVSTMSGPEHRYSFFNDDYQRLVAGRADLGRPLIEVVPEVAAQGFVAILDRVYATGEPFTSRAVPALLYDPATQQMVEHYVDLSYQALVNEQGQITGILAFVVDVTDGVVARQQADAMQAAMLAESQRRVQQREDLYQVFEQAPAAIMLLREPSHRVEYVNPAYARFFPEHSLRGQLLTDVHPDAAASGAIARLDQVYQTGETYVGEEEPVAVVLVPGQVPQTRYFNFTYQPYREENHTVGVSIFAYDVTEAVLARRATSQEQERQRGELRRIFEQAPVGIYLMRGPEFTIELINDTAADMWGTVPATMLGRSWLDIAPGLVGSELLAAWQRILQTGEPSYQHEVYYQLNRAVRGKPDAGYFNVAYQPWRDEQGQVAGIIAVGIEVTEEVQARQQTERLNQELEDRVQQRTQELQTAQAATERERALLQALLTQAPVAIGLFQGEESRIVAANERIASLWGRTPQEVLGQTLVQAVPELVGQGFDDLLRQVRTTRIPFVGTEAPATMLRNGRLQTTYYNYVYQPLYDADGQLLGIINVAVEVTEQVEGRQKVQNLNEELAAINEELRASNEEYLFANGALGEAQQQLQQLNEKLEARVQERTRQLTEQQALLRQILGQVPAAVATTSGPEHRYTFFNELYQAQATNRAALGAAVADVLPQLVEQGFVNLLDQVYATGTPYVGTDTPIKLLDAQGGKLQQRYIDFIYQPLFDAQRQVQGILAFVLDVTDRALARQQAEQSQQQVYALNEELAAMNEELQASNEELHASNHQLTRTNNDLDTFVYTASHDLRTPITNIEGLLSALRDYLPPQPDPDQMVPRLLEMMQASVARFQQTIGHLTDVSRLQHAAAEPAEAIVLAHLVEDVRLDLVPLLQATRGQLLLDLDEGPTIFFSLKNLRSIVYNLLSNALKYRAPERDPVVQVRARYLDDRVVLEVQDNGLGLTEVHQAKLFSLFQRLHTHVEGTGVGLYMLKRIVENAGGTITVHSELGVGSTFRVTLPRARP